MNQSANDQLRRLLEIIPVLARDTTRPLDDVAREAGVEADVILRDLTALSDRLDDPGGFVPGLQIYLDQNRELSLVPGHFRRPMRLVRRELAALELGLAMLRLERSPNEYPGIDGARDQLGKIVATLPPGDDEEEPAVEAARVASLPVAGDPVLLRRLELAQRERRKVRLAYRKPAASSATVRTICPYAVVHASGMWYVVARCEESDGIRIFRLDRVAEVELLDEHFVALDDAAVDAILESGRAFHASDAPVLRIRYSPRIARWIAEREGRQLAPDGSLVLDHPLADPDWAVRHVLQYGPDAEVLEPAAVREAVVARLAGLP